jgi:hypothetical protein
MLFLKCLVVGALGPLREWWQVSLAAQIGFAPNFVVALMLF